MCIFFDTASAKIFVSMNLARLGMPGTGQNIESQGLKSKILPNKDLASDRKPLAVGPW
jgi:hypothetical protein